MMKYKKLEEYIIEKNSKLLNISIYLKLLKENYHNVSELEDFDGFIVIFKSYKAALFNMFECHVDMDLLINADIVIERKNHNSITTNENFTFKLDIIVNKTIGTPKIINCLFGDYLREFIKKDSLSDTLIPYIYKENYEEVAEEFISYFFQEKNTLSIPITLENVLENNSISIVREQIKESKKGYFVFRDNETYKENTIVINTDFYNNNDAKENETIVHELLHYYLHKKHVEYMLVLNEHIVDSIGRIDIDAISNIEYQNINDRNIMELQCANLTPYILIPKKAAIQVIEELLQNNKNKYINYSYSEIFKLSISEFAVKFNVTEKMARIRLETLGYDKYNYPKKDDVKIFDNKVRRISYNDFTYLTHLNPNFKILVENEFVVYIDGYVVFNLPEYVILNSDGYHLTKYAYANISECTFGFEQKKVNILRNKCFDYSVLNHETQKNTIVYLPESELKFIISQYTNLEDSKRKKDFFRNFKYTEQGYYYNDYLKILMSRHGYTTARLSETSKISESTIKKYRSPSNKTITHRVTLALCIGMNCFPYEIFSILKIIGYNIEKKTDMMAEEQKAHHDLIVNYYDRNIDFWNDYLKERELPSLK